MTKKLTKSIDYIEGFHLIGIVSQLKDYNLAYFINQNLDIELKKYNDFNFEDCDGMMLNFSWYCHKDEHLLADFHLISNSSVLGKLIPSKKEMDYFILLRDFPSKEYSNEILPKMREIHNIQAVFNLDINKIKNADFFIENLELQESKYLKQLQKYEQSDFQ